MALLGDLGDLTNVRQGRDEDGDLYYWVYSTDYEEASCHACRMGTCIQKVIFCTKEDGSIDAQNYAVVHDCRKELS